VTKGTRASKLITKALSSASPLSSRGKATNRVSEKLVGGKAVKAAQSWHRRAGLAAGVAVGADGADGKEEEKGGREAKGRRDWLEDVRSVNEQRWVRPKMPTGSEKDYRTGKTVHVLAKVTEHGNKTDRIIMKTNTPSTPLPFPFLLFPCLSPPVSERQAGRYLGMQACWAD